MILCEETEDGFKKVLKEEKVLVFPKTSHLKKYMKENPKEFTEGKIYCLAKIGHGLRLKKETAIKIEVI